MAGFVLICRDRPDALSVRMATREAHLAWVAEHRDVVRRAGPIVDEAGAMAGSLFILEAESEDAVRAFHAQDPYARAGLFGQVEILRWRQTVGDP